MARNTIICELKKISKLEIEDIIKHTVRFLIQFTKFVGVQHKDKIYEELPNSRSQKEDFKKNEMKYECMIDYGEVHECDLDRKIKRKQMRGGARFVWKFCCASQEEIKDVYDRFETENEDSEENTHIFPPVIDYLIGLETVDPKIPFYNGKINLINESGFNDDHRGSDHNMFNLSYCDDVTLSDPTLDEFVCALYQIKSHKYDKWYELYTDSKVEINGNDLVIKTSFDHGS